MYVFLIGPCPVHNIVDQRSAPPRAYMCQPEFQHPVWNRPENAIFGDKSNVRQYCQGSRDIAMAPLQILRELTLLSVAACDRFEHQGQVVALSGIDQIQEEVDYILMDGPV